VRSRVAPWPGARKRLRPRHGSCKKQAIKGLVPSLAVVGNSKVKDSFYTVNGKDLAKTTLVLGVKYNF
jgi:hypothetical protein